MEIRDFMTKENLEMIGLAVMCDRYSDWWRGYGARHGICVSTTPRSASYDNFKDMICLGKDITTIMDFFEKLKGECRIKDVSKYLEEKDRRYISSQRITAVCRRLCASGYLKQRYSAPYKITVRTFDWVFENGHSNYKEVTKEITVRDSLYSLA